MTGRVREAAAGLSGTFVARDLNDALGIQKYAEAHRVRQVIKEMKRRGEIRGIERGVYEYVLKEKKRTKLDVIWHLVRSHRQFGTDEIERLSGAARDTVLEYLRCLRRLGYLKKVRQSHWRMINDPGPETPVNTGKCNRLRGMRQKMNHESTKGGKHERGTR